MVEKIRQRRPAGEDPTEKKVRRRRSTEEGGYRKRGPTPKPIMTLIPCEMREEKNIFLY